jgi:hypothetical protein
MTVDVALKISYNTPESSGADPHWNIGSSRNPHHIVKVHLNKKIAEIEDKKSQN